MTQTILVAGSTGMLGSRIAHHLVRQPDTRIRLLVRGANHNPKRGVIEPLLALGAELVDGYLADRNSLDRASAGVDVIVSAVQGGPDVIVDGQIALAEVGRLNGVRRMLPSDFALDFFKARPGEHFMFNLRQQADAAIAATGIEAIHILQGGFMEMFRLGGGVLDAATKTVSYWGDGQQLIELTSVEDTARMTARVALDRSVKAGKFAFAGDRVSFQQVAAIVEKETGLQLQRVSLGSEEALRSALAKAQQDHANPFQAVMLAYQLYMLTGQTALENLQNDRYPDLRLETFSTFAARSLRTPS